MSARRRELVLGVVVNALSTPPGEYGRYLVTTSPQSLTLPWSTASEVSTSPSGKTNSHGVTGGVYKARERIHRGVLIRDY